MMQAFLPEQLFTGQEFLTQQALLVERGSIVDLCPAGKLPSAIHCETLPGTLVPGFVDVQVNGGGGALFNDSPGLNTLKTMAQAHARFGTTTLLPTLITDSFTKMQQAIAAVSEAIRIGMPGIRGVHLEGPYLNPVRRGVHRESEIRTPEPEALDLLGAGGNGMVTLVTLAPESVPGGFIRALRDRGVRVFLGHSDATYEQTRAAFAEGAAGVTHLFNAMSPLHHREPGMVGAVLEEGDVYCGIIADGHHVHPAVLRLASRAIQAGRLLLVTDAMHTVGVAGSRFELLGESILRDRGRLATQAGVLAGSDLDMSAAIRNMMNLAGVRFDEALRMASCYPAQMLGLGDRIGSLQPGFAADMVLLDKQKQVTATWIAGRQIALAQP